MKTIHQITGNELWHKISVLIVLFVLTGCKIGWENMESKKYESRTTKSAFYLLPLTVQEIIKEKIKSGNYHSAFSADPQLELNDYFLVSADYQGFPLRKMGHYLRINEKRYFLEYKKGEPIIIHDGHVYYTSSLNLGKGINQQEDWLDSTMFFCVNIKN